MNEGPIIWKSRKQSIVATSSTDAEYVAAHDASKEIVWARVLMQELGHQQVKPTKLFIDNIAALKLVDNPAFHRRTKHIDIKYHYTRDLVSQGHILMEHIPSCKQLADILTKVLTTELFKINRDNLKIRPSFCREWEC